MYCNPTIIIVIFPYFSLDYALIYSYNGNYCVEKNESWKGDMEKTVYITDDERKKCRNIVDAYAKLIEGKNMTVLDAGKYSLRS